MSWFEQSSLLLFMQIDDKIIQVLRVLAYKQNHKTMTNIPPALKLPSLVELKMTRTVEADPRHKSIEELLKKDRICLWEKSALKVSRIQLTPSLATCLQTVIERKQLKTGLDQIERLLNNEQKGLLALKSKENTPSSNRVSRLLIVSSDGSERFYRSCEKILLHQKDRLLLLYLDEHSDKLAEGLMMPKSKMILKALLITEKEAVSDVLLSLVEVPPKIE